MGYLLIPAKAKIEIWPKKENIEETITVAVVPDQRSGNFLKGEISELERIVSQEFIAQGAKIKAVKASGIIRVYNGYSTASQTLVATTRFLSDDGKLFRTPKRVVIPGGHYEGGKLVSGFLDIEVVADQPGEEYNIDPSTFSIPGLAGTPKYTAFYAKSFEPMKGGEKKEVPQVTQKDLDKAQEILTERALAESGIALKDSISSKDYVIINEAVTTKVVDFKADAEAGREIDKFSAQVKVLAGAIIFKESELKNFARNYIQGSFSPEEKLIEQSLQIDYSLESADLSKNELVLKLVISAQSQSAPGEIQLKEIIKNKNAEEIKNILKGFPQIEKARVELWPFWVSSAPENLDRIEVVLRF